MKQGELGADFIMNKMAYLINLIPSDANEWSITLQIFHFLLKSVVTLIYLLLFMFYLFQHAIIIVLLIGLKQTWDACWIAFWDGMLMNFPNYKFSEVLKSKTFLFQGISIYSEIKRCVTLFNDFITVPMLLIYLTNLTTFATLQKYLECKGCSGWEGPVTRMKVLIDVSYTMFIWLMSSKLHQEVLNQIPRYLIT